MLGNHQSLLGNQIAILGCPVGNHLPIKFGKPCITSLKSRCTKSLVLSNTTWGADIKVLLRLYRALIGDSKSALQALLSKWDYPTVLTIMKFLFFLHTVHTTVIFCWLPSYMGISGNERADSAAKAALQKDVFNCLISYTDTYQYISQYVRDMWQREWDTAVNNKLHATKPLIGEQSSEVVLSRLRLRHSYLTHSYLLKGEPLPECVTCNCRLTISHILVDCIEY